jgi:hypothetical protein
MLSGEHRLRVSENRVLRGIFGPKRDEVTGDCRKLKKEELHCLYSFRNIIGMIKSRRMGGTCSTHGEMKNAHKILIGKPERKRPLVRPMHRWEDNNKMDVREIGFGSVEWIHMAQDRNRCLSVLFASHETLCPMVILELFKTDPTLLCS